jgi:hypothetical protein
LKVRRLAPIGGAITSAARALDGDFRAGSRLETVVDGGGDQRYLHVLSHGAALTAVASVPEGATLTLANGKVVTVQFEKNAIGGSINYDGTTTQLGAGVDSLPE